MMKIGMLVPASNLTVEYELQYLFTNHPEKMKKFTFYVDRLHYHTGYSCNYKKYLQELVDECNSKLIAMECLNIDYFSFFCTSATILYGNMPNAICPSESIISLAKAQNVQKCMLITPYNEDLGTETKCFLEKRGIAVEKTINLGLSGSRNFFEYGKNKLINLLKKNYKEEYGAIIISCTNFPTLCAIDIFGKQIQAPIISSNSSMFWEILGK